MTQNVNLDVRLEDGSTSTLVPSTSPSGGAPGVALNPAATPAATTQTISTSVRVGRSGTITWGGSMGTANQPPSTAPVTDVIEVVPLLDGGPVPAAGPTSTGPSAGAQPIGHACAIPVPFVSVSGLVPGSTHTIALQASDFTVPANTFNLPGAGAAGIVWWSP